MRAVLIVRGGGIVSSWEKSSTNLWLGKTLFEAPFRDHPHQSTVELKISKVKQHNVERNLGEKKQQAE